MLTQPLFLPPSALSSSLSSLSLTTTTTPFQWVPPPRRPHHHLLLLLPPIRMGGGPRTFPGGVSKWQWKRMQAKKSKQLLKARLLRERHIYDMRKRSELKAAVSALEKPWELVEKAPTLFSVTADEQVKALADRFVKPGGFDMWSDHDGPRVFRTIPGEDALLPSRRFFPEGAVHSVRPYGVETGDDRAEGVRWNESKCIDVEGRVVGGEKGDLDSEGRNGSARGSREIGKNLSRSRVTLRPTSKLNSVRGGKEVQFEFGEFAGRGNGRLGPESFKGRNGLRQSDRGNKKNLGGSDGRAMIRRTSEWNSDDESGFRELEDRDNGHLGSEDSKVLKGRNRMRQGVRGNSNSGSVGNGKNMSRIHHRFNAEKTMGGLNSDEGNNKIQFRYGELEGSENDHSGSENSKVLKGRNGLRQDVRGNSCSGSEGNRKNMSRSYRRSDAEKTTLRLRPTSKLNSDKGNNKIQYGFRTLKDSENEHSGSESLKVLKGRNGLRQDVRGNSCSGSERNRENMSRSYRPSSAEKITPRPTSGLNSDEGNNKIQYGFRSNRERSM